MPGEHQTEPLANLRVADLVAEVASDRVAPGAGAAGAVTLALAAACAAKAAAISLKRANGDATLAHAVRSFQEIARSALDSAQRDSTAFEHFIHERSEAAAEHLIETDEAQNALRERLLSGMHHVQRRIVPNVAGDFVAAKALIHAAHAITQRNVAETTAAKD